jgi:hypothetical protein
MSGRHAGSPVARRGSMLLMTVATVLGLWFGVTAPDVSPVAAPLPAAPAQPADVSAVIVPAPAPVVPVPPVAGGPQRGGRR